MKNQFFFTKIQLQPVEGKTEPQYKEVLDSFNINKVIRSVTMDNGNVLVLLDDFHQRKESVPVFSKSGKQTGVKNEIGTFQSEIFLTEKEDIERFNNLLAII